MNQQVFFGYNTISNLEQIIIDNGYNNIFLVVDKKSYSFCGAEKAINKILQKRNVFVFNDYEINPHLNDVNKGIDAIKKGDFDCLIAVGGGTAIDMAKLVNILSNQKDNPQLIIRNEAKITNKGRPLIVIPTTAGTGSEATHFAVVYIDKTKYSLAHQYVLPVYAIIDPTFTLSMPPLVTASTGFDALSQGIESLWSVNSTKESLAYSTEAINIALSNLKSAVLYPDKENRKNMAYSAHLAGKAINITKTTAPHALSYYFTSFHNISHGHAVGLTLGKFIKYNSRVTETDVADKRGVNFVHDIINKLCKILSVPSPEAAEEKIERLMNDIGLETEYKKLGINIDEEIDAIIKSINLERLKNNPRQVTCESLKIMFQ